MKDRRAVFISARENMFKMINMKVLHNFRPTHMCRNSGFKHWLLC